MTLELRKLLLVGLGCVGGVIASLLGLATLVAIFSSAPSTPKDILRLALEEHGRSGFNMFATRPGATMGGLRGLTLTDAQSMLASCRRAENWTLLGEERRSAGDCPQYTLFTCARESGSLIARLRTDGPVDHRTDFVYQSDFLACRTGQCPDFAVGEPRNDGVLTCETLFKVNKTVTRP
ncbi:MAG: hypothetical protein QM773_04775 [Hyphomonadaceae bacterium]